MTRYWRQRLSLGQLKIAEVCETHCAAGSAGVTNDAGKQQNVIDWLLGPLALVYCGKSDIIIKLTDSNVLNV